MTTPSASMSRAVKRAGLYELSDGCLFRLLRCQSCRCRRTISTRSSLNNARLEYLPRRSLLDQDYFHANRAPRTTPKTPTKQFSGLLKLARKLGSPEGLHPRRPKKLLYFEHNTASRPRVEPRLEGLQDGRRNSHEGSQPVQSHPTSSQVDFDIPLDASSRLSILSANLPTRSFRRSLSAYLALSKPRLSFLMLLTTTTAYSLYPVPALLLPSVTTSPSLSTLTLLFLATGTALSSASANSLNMLLESEHDAKMSRTRNRPLVRKLVSKRGAALFAALTGAGGLGLLLYGVNPTVAFLSALNIVLYAGVYTPMKRISVANTWIGAIVGGIPPLMGWAAAAGQSATNDDGWRELLFGDGSMGGWLLAGLLFAWQFPHFNALSWPVREEYKNAGYKMMAWVNPRANARISLRYSLLFFPICFGLWWVGVTDQGFLVTSSVVNAWLVREAWKFWRKTGAKGSARGLFWAGVWQLPVLFVLAMVHKKGLWEGVWRSLTRREIEEDEAVWIDEDEMVPASSV